MSLQVYAEIQALQKERQRQENLPHLYRHKLYKWQRKFWDSTNRMNFLTAANQIGKSSINIKKAIHWATAKPLWSTIWPLKIIHPNDTPNMFWYLYPDAKVATQEFHEKWVPEFLPRGEMKDDPVYGWKPIFDKRLLEKIVFNSGVTIYFKTYKQNPQSLQSGTVYAVYCDEELPFSLYDELKMRLSNTEGFFHMVFTATLNQAEWRQTMEVKGKKEKFPHAFKQQISLYDCMKYEDGSPSYWTKARIRDRIDDCGSEVEVQRRIFGRFVTEEGVKYNNYDPDVHIIDKREIPKNWFYYVGVDIGSGGKKGHPSAIVFVAISPELTEGIVTHGWRGDGIETTSGDVVQKYLNMVDEYNLTARVNCVYYDWADKDFHTIAQRVGLNVLPANKSHHVGEGVLNSLFKYNALKIFDKEELNGLGEELVTVTKGAPKHKAADDFIDALRYATSAAPWYWEAIKPRRTIVKKEFDPVLDEITRRRGLLSDGDRKRDIIEEELDLWNDLLD